MRFLSVALTLLLVTSSLASAWDCSPKCPDYDDCINRVRHLSEEDTRNVTLPAISKKLHHLRQPRHLQQIAFLLKLYHEESPDYCWQGEWEDRFWCLECYQCGDCDPVTCDEGDSLWIKYCDGSKREQYLTYEQVSGGVRLKPFMNPSLCLEWEGPGGRDLTFQPCDNSNTLQILVGFVDFFQGPFELYPYGEDPDSTSDPLCLTQSHHPRKRELLRTYSCETARDDRTSFWQVYEAIVEGEMVDVIEETAEPTMAPTADDEFTSWPTPSPDYVGAAASPIESPIGSPIGSPIESPIGSPIGSPIES